MALVCSASATLSLEKLVPFTSQSSITAFGSSFPFNRESASVVPLLVVCRAKKKIGFFDQILDYIEGGPKLRKWYGAPDLLPKDGTATEEDEEEYPEDEVRDAVLVTDGDSEMGQIVILSLIVKKSRVKALVKDKRDALEAFGSYVEVGEVNLKSHQQIVNLYCFLLLCLFSFIFSLLIINCMMLVTKSLAGDTTDSRFLKKALRGIHTIICPNEGFLSRVGSLQGVKHVILLSQLSVYSGKSGIQSMMKSNAKNLAEQDESALMTLGIPYTIIRTGELQNTPGGKQGFSFDKGCAAIGSISKEDAAFVCRSLGMGSTNWIHN